MDLVRSAVEVLAVTLLGLQAGATAAEGAVLVPLWRSMRPEAFLAWYREHASLLFQFFGPLEVAAAGSAIAAAGLNWFSNGRALGLWSASAVCAVAVLAAFPLYFQRANSSFVAGTIAVEQVPDELRRWAALHWIRVGLAVVAFVLTAVALVQGIHAGA